MPSTGRRPGCRRAAVAATAVAACLAFAATACGAGDTSTDAKPTEEATGDESASRDEDLQEILDGLPFEIDLDEWVDGGWRNWDRDKWLDEIGEFVNPVIEGLWDQDRMGDAEDPGQSVEDDEISEDEDAPETGDPADDRGVTDAEPEAVEAEAVATPYGENQGVVGKVFFDTPEGSMVCSGTVVKDPDHPGESNLVATAGHCVHAGGSGGWYRNISFVPSYNDSGLSAEETYEASLAELAPYGIWWAEYVSTTQYWIDNGSTTGGDGSHGDFAIMAVQPEDGSGESLEERVGGAVDIDFDAPAVSGLGEVSVYGYPAADPYDGALMYECAGTPSRLSLDADMPVMYRTGCTMTGGASGGPWLRTGDSGEPELISVTSVGPADSTWLAGPRLEEEARDVLDYVSAQVT